MFIYLNIKIFEHNQQEPPVSGKTSSMHGFADLN
jgi:hypothetical protein